MRVTFGKKARNRAGRSHEWNDGKKDMIYCCGLIAPMTDTLMDECRSCPKNVNHAQDDLNAFLKKRSET